MFDRFTPDVACAKGREDDIAMCVLHDGTKDSSLPTLRYLMRDGASIPHCKRHCALLWYDVVRMTVFTDRATW